MCCLVRKYQRKSGNISSRDMYVYKSVGYRKISTSGATYSLICEQEKRSPDNKPPPLETEKRKRKSQQKGEMTPEASEI